MKLCAGWVLSAALALTAPIGGAAQAASPPSSGGTIVIEPHAADGGYDPSMPAFVEAASAALDAKGFTILEYPAHTAYEVELILNRDPVGTGLAKDPGGASVGMAGTGVVVPFSTGRSNVVTLTRTRLELRIRKRGEDGFVWDAAAVTVRAGGTRKGTDQAVATDLAQALMQAYPAQPPEVIGIP